MVMALLRELEAPEGATMCENVGATTVEAIKLGQLGKSAVRVLLRSDATDEDSQADHKGHKVITPLTDATATVLLEFLQHE